MIHIEDHIIEEELADENYGSKSLKWSLISLLINPIILMYPLALLFGHVLFGVLPGTLLSLLAIGISLFYGTKEYQNIRSIIGVFLSTISLSLIILVWYWLFSIRFGFY